MQPNFKRQKSDAETTTFQDLPDEIILKIFNYLSIKDLCHCATMNRKMRSISSDESLWYQMHLTGKFSAKLLKQTLDRGCRYLSLYRCNVFSGNIRFKKNFQLKYLNLQNSDNDARVSNNFGSLFMIF